MLYLLPKLDANSILDKQNLTALRMTSTSQETNSTSPYLFSMSGTSLRPNTISREYN